MPNKKFTITTSDGKEHKVSEYNINEYGIDSYANAYEGATIRMRNDDDEDYDIPLSEYNDAIKEGLHAFSEDVPLEAQRVVAPDFIQPQQTNNPHILEDGYGASKADNQEAKPQPKQTTPTYENDGHDLINKNRQRMSIDPHLDASMYKEKPQPKPVENEYAEGVAEGWDSGMTALKAGMKHFAGETANLFSGSSYDYIKALNRMDNADDANTYTADPALREQDKLIRDAIKEAGGDLDKARRILSDKASVKTWGDKMMDEASSDMSKVKPTKGFGAWVGNMLPQMVPNASAMALSLITKNPRYAQMVGGLGMGAMTASTAGMSMQEARNAGASDAQTWAVGVIDGAIEGITEAIPYNKQTKKIFANMRQTASRAFAEAVENPASPARNELEKLLKRANKELGGKLFTGKNLEDYLSHMTAEGWSEFTAEALQTITPIIYQNPDEYPTIMDVISNGFEGMKGGLFMGAALGGASKIAEHHQQRSRRKEQGYVDIAQVKTADGGDDVVEVVGGDPNSGKVQVLKDGELSVIDEGDIMMGKRFSFEEFDAAAMESEADESFENGYNLTPGQEQNDAKNMYELKRQQMTEQLGIDEATLDSDEVDWVNEARVSQDEGRRNIILDYLNAKNTYEGMVQKVRDDIDSQVEQNNALIDSRINKETGKIQGATMRHDERPVFVVRGKIAAGDDGISVSKKLSDESVVVMDSETGKLEMVSPGDLLDMSPELDPEQLKQQDAQAISEQIATTASDAIDGKVTSFNPGESYTIAGEDGNPTQARIVANEMGLVDNGDGTVNATVDGKTIVPIQKDVIQQQIDAANMARAVQYDAERNAQRAAEQQQVAPDVPQQKYGTNYTVTVEDGKGGTTEGLITDMSPDGGYIVDYGYKVSEQSADDLEASALSIKDADGNEIYARPIQEEVAPAEEVVQEEASTIEEPGVVMSEDGKPDLVASGVENSLAYMRGMIGDEKRLEKKIAVTREHYNNELKKAQKALDKAAEAYDNAPFGLEDKEKQNLDKAQAAYDAVSKESGFWDEMQSTLISARITQGDRVDEAWTEMASEISSMGEPVNGEELAAMMLANGQIRLLRDDYLRETGYSNSEASKMFPLFRTKDKGGITVEQAGEAVMLADSENNTHFFDEADANAGRNAILEVLSAARTPGDLTNYIKSKRDAQARKEQEAELAHYEDQIQRDYHMSLAEYEAYVERTRKENPFADVNEDEIYAAFADAATEYFLNNNRDGKERTTENIEGGGNVLPAEQSDNAERNARSEEVGEPQEPSGGTTGKNEIAQEEVESTVQAKIESAEAETNTNPSEAQKESGNYKKGHVKVAGFDISIEQPKGSVRSGVDGNGTKWETEMKNTYGYFRGTEGVDGDHIDVFLADNMDAWDNTNVFVVDQYNEDGTFDEHKVMLGFNSKNDAEAAYFANYDSNWAQKHKTVVTPISLEDFKKWVDSSHRKTKPFAEYKEVKKFIREATNGTAAPADMRKLVDTVCDKLGLKVEWHNTLEENGRFDPETNTIHIAMDAENPLQHVFGHEATHAIKSISNEAYDDVKNAVKNMLDESWDVLVAGKKRLYESHGYKNYPLEYYEEEVVCDAVGRMLSDKKIAERLVFRMNHSVLSKIQDVLRKIREALQRFVGKEKSSVDNLIEAIDKAMKTAAMKAGEKILTNSGEEAGYIDGKGNYRASERTFHNFTDRLGVEHEGTRERTKRFLEERGLPKKQIDKFMETMDYWYNLNKKLTDLTDEDGNFRFQAFHEWSQTVPAYKQWENKIIRAVSTLVANGEYPVNIELSTDCIKREAFTQILDEMITLDNKFWAKLSPANIVNIQTLEKAYGIQVACPLCFVEGKRLGLMAWAKKIVKKWDEALVIATGTKEHPEFGFGKGTFIPPTDKEEYNALSIERKKDLEKQINEVCDIINTTDEISPEDLDAIRQADTRIAKKLDDYEEKWVKKHGSLDGFVPSKEQLAELMGIATEGGKSAVDRMARAIEQYPELRRRLTIEDLVGSKGLMAIRTMDGTAYETLFSLIRSANGTGTPKLVQTAQPYDGEIINLSQARINKASRVGGVRIFSFSDFDLTKIFDIMQILFDCAARAAKIQSYSKEVPYILIFGTSGVKINMSMLPEARPDAKLVKIAIKGNGKSKESVNAMHTIKEYVGLEMSEDGKILGLQLSSSHSIPEDFAKSIFHDDKYNANCGAIMVGIGVNHAIYSMCQPHIRMVIPFHLSGMPIEARKKTDCVYYVDFTKDQNTGIIKDGKRVKLISSSGSNHPTIKEDFDFYADENEPGWNMRDKCREYIEWCETNGLVPKFDWAINSEHYKKWCEENGYEPNAEIVAMMDADTTDGIFNQYYKVVTDFTAYQPIFDKEGNMIGERVAPHKPVTANFSTDDKVLSAVLGVDSEGNFVDENSMLANRERSIANVNKHFKEIAAKSIELLKGRRINKVLEEVQGEVGDKQFDNKSDSEKYFDAVNSKRYSLRENERETIIEEAIADGTYMKAPNGEDTNLDEEQWVNVRTQAFKDWFGDWEDDPDNASKILDENGEPRIVYHQTDSTTLVNSETGMDWNDLSYKERNEWKERDDMYDYWEKDDFYVFDNKYHGRRSIEMPAFFFSPKYDDGHEYGERTIAAFLNIRNPIKNPTIPNKGMYDDSGERAMLDYINQGYDGFIREFDGVIDEINAFFPNQIKSADENDGTYSRYDDDIRYSIREGKSEDDYIYLREVTDKETLNRLNNGPTVTVYRAMQLIDGGLRPPMSAKVNGELREATKIGVWEEAEERPDLANDKGQFVLNKGNGKSIPAAYNPYLHTSRSPINDQFSSAWSRPELVTVEVEIPESELTSGYQAEKAKDSVGEKSWKSGPVGRALAKVGNPRKVILSRWGRIKGIVPINDVAKEYAKILNQHGIEVPFNTVPPALRDALVANGVKIGPPEKGNAGNAAMPAYDEWLNSQGKESPKQDGGQLSDRVKELAEKMHLDNVKIVTNSSELDGKMARAKGWFNAKTNEIVIVLPNNKSVADVEETLLHEAVAHYGLRKLFGANFDNFLDNVFNNASTSVRRKIVELSTKYDWNFRKATEEYLASLAEKTDFENAVKSGWFEKVKDFFMEMLDNFGVKLSKKLKDNELRYILWKSYENLKGPGGGGGGGTLFDKASDVAKQYEMKVGNYRSGSPTSSTRYSVRENEKPDLMDIIKKTPMWVDMRIKNPQMSEEEIGDALIKRFSSFNADEKFDEEVKKIADSKELGTLQKGDRIGAINTFRRAMQAGGKTAPSDPMTVQRVAARRRYEDRVSRGAYQMQEAIQDSMLGLKELMQSVLGEKAERIEDVVGFENAYLGENRLSSVNQAEMEAFTRLKFKPLLELIAKMSPDDASYSDLIDYMMSKHGLERNESMARRNAHKQVMKEFGKELREAERKANKDLTNDLLAEDLEAVRQQMAMREEELYYENRRDYSGLTALTQKQGLMEAEEDAKQIVESYERGHKEDVNELWERIKDISTSILQKTYEGGLIDKKTLNDITSMYQYYIPLRGFDEKVSADAYAYLNPDKGAFCAPIKVAKGRSSKADNPIAFLQSMADSTIMQSNRNKLVKQRFLNFVINHPSDLTSVSDLWLEYNFLTEEYEPVLPNNITPDDTAEEVEEKMREFESRMIDLSNENPGVYVRSKDEPDIPYKVVTNNDMHQHQVIVKRNGRDIVITVNGNPRAAQAVNGLTNPDNDASGAIGKMLELGESMNRHLSAFYTTRNPDFVVSNFLRDAVYTNSMVWLKEGKNYSLAFHRNYMNSNPIQMGRLLKKYRENTLDMDNKTEAMFYQFMMNGGETGYSNLKDIETHKRNVARELDKNRGKIPMKKAWDEFSNKLDEWNRATENCARFAAFVTSREMGRSIERSVFDSKEISVNFNKKGAGSKFMGKTGQTKLGNIASFISGMGRPLFVFWNAAIQGTANFAKQAKRNPKKAYGAMSTAFVLGAVAAALGAATDDDDKEGSYFDLSETTRRSNLMFRVGDSWISIPLPVEYRAVYGLGEMAMSLMSGKAHLSAGEIAEQTAAQLSQMLPLDIMNDGGLLGFTPSSVKPFAEVIANKSWTGLPIYKDSDHNKDMPEWTKAYKGANTYIVGLFKALNEITGGDKYTSGRVDWNPAVVEHLLRGYFGGIFNMLDKTTKMAETVVGDREYEHSSFLFLNKVLKTGDERTEYRAVNNEYFRLKSEADKVGQRLRGYEKDTNNGVMDYAAKIDFLYNSPEYARYEIFEAYNKDIKALNEELKLVVDEDERKELEAIIHGIKKEMLDMAYNRK